MTGRIIVLLCLMSFVVGCSNDCGERLPKGVSLREIKTEDGVFLQVTVDHSKAEIQPGTIEDFNRHKGEGGGDSSFNPMKRYDPDAIIKSKIDPEEIIKSKVDPTYWWHD